MCILSGKEALNRNYTRWLWILRLDLPKLRTVFDCVSKNQKENNGKGQFEKI